MNDPFESYSEEEARRIARWISAYIKGTISEKDHEELDAWVSASEENMLLFERLTDPEYMEQALAMMDRLGKKLSFENLRNKAGIRTARVQRLYQWIGYGITAAVIITLGFALWYFNRPVQQMQQVPEPRQLSELIPAQEKAALLLPDGKVILLDTITQNHVLDTRSIRLEKAGDELQLSGSNQANTQYLQEHTIRVPGGGHYRIRLSDGTHVWINSASSISFPVQFTARERRVKITGEVFFDVTGDPGHPFIVEAGNHEVYVTGTRFNINAYSDEPELTVCLLEGAVSLKAEGKQALLKPGQSGIVGAEGIRVVEADTSEVIAWKENQFVFRDEEIRPIMRQIARWYNIPVSYESQIKGHFTAALPRNIPASKILQYLEQTGGVRFSLRNDSIIVR